MGPADLTRVLEALAGYHHPNLLVGLNPGDDAAVYKLGEEEALIQTVDFFPPVVDEPYAFGGIAAANAMSDVYAMGGKVLLAVNIVGFPQDLPLDILREIIRGGADKMAEAGGIVAGGHTLLDTELKYGLCVIGTVHPQQTITNAGARAGDVLILTKPLGAGLITTALKAGLAEDAHVEAVTASMLELNKHASEAMVEVGVNACTDITGFGLLGHASNMAEQSGVRLALELEEVPFLDGALEYTAGFMPAGGWRNREYLMGDLETLTSPKVSIAPGLPLAKIDVLFNPETSGGLLISVPSERVSRLEELFQQRGQSYWIIGRVLEGRGIEVA